MTSSTVPIRALICDCDGVLIDSETVAARVLVAELEARWPGARVKPVVMPLLGQRIERVLAGAAAELGRALSADDVAAIRAVAESAAMEAPMFDGVVEALRAIALMKACASNSYTSVVRAVLDRTGLVEFFGERVFCADRVERPKPAPDVYLAAARGLGVEPAACLVVEDSIAGVTAAHAAGMTVLGFVGGSHIGHGGEGAQSHVLALRDAGAVEVFDRMSALPELAGKWIAIRDAATGVR